MLRSIFLVAQPPLLGEEGKVLDSIIHTSLTPAFNAPNKFSFELEVGVKPAPTCLIHAFIHLWVLKDRGSISAHRFRWGWRGRRHGYLHCKRTSLPPAVAGHRDSPMMQLDEVAKDGQAEP